MKAKRTKATRARGFAGNSALLTREQAIRFGHTSSERAALLVLQFDEATLLARVAHSPEESAAILVLARNALDAIEEKHALLSAVVSRVGRAVSTLPADRRPDVPTLASVLEPPRRLAVG